jgi:hypothetical protein
MPHAFSGFALLVGLLVQSAGTTVPHVEPEPKAKAIEAPYAARTALLPALTVIELETVDMVSSGVHKPGDFFELRVASPVKVGETVLIPAGTPAIGQVVHSAKRGMAGKPGELILAARYVELPSAQVKLRATLGSVGKNNNNAAAGVIIAASALAPVGAFIGLGIQGRNTVLPAGTLVAARTAVDTEIVVRDENQPTPTPTATENPLQ